MSNNPQPKEEQRPQIQAPVRLLHPAAMTTQELRTELLDIHRFNPDLDPQIQLLPRENRDLYRHALVEILIRLRANQPPMLPAGWANPFMEPPPHDDFVRVENMTSNELITELTSNYPLNAETLTPLPIEVLAQLLENFRLRGYNQTEFENAIARRGGRRKRKSKQGRKNRRRSNRK
jgi:hypothetical protein